MSFGAKKFQILLKSNLFIFPVIAFVVISQKSLPNLTSLRFVPTFYSEIFIYNIHSYFIIYTLTWSFIHFELYFVYGFS